MTLVQGYEIYQFCNKLKIASKIGLPNIILKYVMWYEEDRPSHLAHRLVWLSVQEGSARRNAIISDEWWYMQWRINVVIPWSTKIKHHSLQQTHSYSYEINTIYFVIWSKRVSRCQMFFFKVKINQPSLNYLFVTADVCIIITRLNLSSCFQMMGMNKQ